MTNTGPSQAASRAAIRIYESDHMTTWQQYGRFIDAEMKPLVEAAEAVLHAENEHNAGRMPPSGRDARRLALRSALNSHKAGGAE